MAKISLEDYMNNIKENKDVVKTLDSSIVQLIKSSYKNKCYQLPSEEINLL